MMKSCLSKHFFSEVEIILLNKTARGFRGLVVVNQRSILFGLTGESVLAEACLAYKEVGHVLRGQHGVKRMVNSLVRDTLRVLRPLEVVLLGVPLGAENGVFVGLNHGHKLVAVSVLVVGQHVEEVIQHRGLEEVIGPDTVVVVVHRHVLLCEHVCDKAGSIFEESRVLVGGGEVKGNGVIIGVHLTVLGVQNAGVPCRRHKQPFKTHAGAPQREMLASIVHLFDLVKSVLGSRWELSIATREKYTVEAWQKLV
mmetsp:Transcript_62301/g.109758  ORF Transcript_62301/g.109758 Transcript_62301/m.109758 type:complete len:254 (-) Transcript_62301:218-979(-)